MVSLSHTHSALALFFCACAAPRMMDRVQEPLRVTQEVRTDAAIIEDVAPVDAGLLLDGALADRDHDGIPDERDRCPELPETYNGFEDEDGCQDDPPHLAIIEADNVPQIQLLTMYFPINSIALRGRNERVLEAMALALQRTPAITRLAIIGHASTDERNPNGLSERRARTVAEALQARGIEASRLETHGVGTTYPFVLQGAPPPQRLRRMVHVVVLSVDNRALHRWTGTWYEAVR